MNFEKSLIDSFNSRYSLTSKIFEINEYLELKESIKDFSKFIKEKYSEYEKNVLGY